MPEKPFNRSGLASLDDLATPEWKALFTHLETIQAEFIAAKPHCEDYPWPKDPLHNCIRVWEYPFVYHHLQHCRSGMTGSPSPRVVDLGSGATFFPFAIARLGYSVSAIDVDPRAKTSLQRASAAMHTDPGLITPMLSDASSVPLQTESVDGVYCISVLEHIPDFEAVIAEVWRILRPGGVLVLTFDVDLRGNSELGPSAYKRLMEALHASFSLIYPEKVIHPLRVLTSDNSIYPMYRDRPYLDTLVTPLRHRLHNAYNKLRGRPLPRGRFLAGTYGACLRKNSSAKLDSGSAEPRQTV